MIDRHQIATCLVLCVGRMDEQPHEFLRGRLARLPPLPSFPEDSTGDTDTSTETDSSTASVRTVIPVSVPSLPN